MSGPYFVLMAMLLTGAAMCLIAWASGFLLTLVLSCIDRRRDARRFHRMRRSSGQ